MQTPNYLFFFVGKIASGKETQSRRLADELGWEIFATGNRFREIIASGSPLGARIKDTYDKGLLMPSWVADYMFEDFVFKLAPEKGAIFEGSGRDLQQAKVIEEVSDFLGRPYRVFNLEISDEEVMKRSLGRNRDKTDDPNVVETRLKEYTRLTKPAIEHFRSLGKCVDVDGEQTLEKVHEDVLAEVEKLLV